MFYLFPLLSAFSFSYYLYHLKESPLPLLASKSFYCTLFCLPFLFFSSFENLHLHFFHGLFSGVLSDLFLLFSLKKIQLSRVFFFLSFKSLLLASFEHFFQLRHFQLLDFFFISLLIGTFFFQKFYFSWTLLLALFFDSLGLIFCSKLNELYHPFFNQGIKYSVSLLLLLPWLKSLKWHKSFFLAYLSPLLYFYPLGKVSLTYYSAMDLFLPYIGLIQEQRWLKIKPSSSFMVHLILLSLGFLLLFLIIPLTKS